MCRKGFRELCVVVFAVTLVTAAEHEESSAAGFLPANTERWEPVPPLVTPVTDCKASPPPSDAVVLFDGKGLDEWVNVSDGAPARWRVADGELSVNQAAGNIRTRRRFRDYQLHIEWLVPTDVIGEGQQRGNSGVFLAWTDEPPGGYEIQILDSHQNSTYVNGMAGSVYKQFIPLANPSRPPGHWQCYHIVWTAPRFSADGALESPARVTVYFNGVLVQDNVRLRGRTTFVGQPEYLPHGPAPIALQAHGDPGPPVRFRNIWVR